MNLWVPKCASPNYGNLLMDYLATDFKIIGKVALFRGFGEESPDKARIRVVSLVI